jgi:hypothetical protein
VAGTEPILLAVLAAHCGAGEMESDASKRLRRQQG